MRCSTPLLTLTLGMVLSACGQAQLDITAEIEIEDAEGAMVSRPLSDVEIRLYPFDRDIVFDSLARAAANPEPAIPDSLLASQQSLAEAQGSWRQAESEWLTLRDNLQSISQELEGLNRGESRYVALFNDFRDMEGRMGGAERRMNQAFETFNDLQSSTIAQMEEVRLLREAWADEAYSDVGEVFAARLQGSGREILADTTGSEGTAQFLAFRKGSWWISARYELPFDELYWNVLVNVDGNDPVTIRLDRSNALLRPKL